MSLYNSLCPKNTVYVPIVQLSLQGNVYVLRVQFMSQEYSLCPKSTVYVLIVMFMSSKYTLCPKSTVYVPR